MSDLCPTCLQPKPEQGSGSLTQWVSVCRCEQLESEEELYQSLQICTNCDKRINAARHGSFTQWIFKTELCNCDRPSISITQSDDTAEKSETRTSVVEYPELDVSDRDFPLDRFKPIEEVGSGSSGTVFRCQDRLLKKVVAVKILHDLSPDLVISFQTEARLISKLKHKNIIEIVDINSTENGTPYMVLEYVLGVSLLRHIHQTGLLEWRTAANLIMQICNGLQYAHAKGIFHRDLKPSNILLTRENDDDVFVAKIIDFGIAVIQDEEQSFKYEDQTLAGTPAYMSPDVAHGYEYDERSEIYSLGCILFMSLAGRPPFEGDSPIEILSQQLNNDPPLLSDLIDDGSIPTSIEQITGKCLEKAPGARYQSIEDLRQDLFKCLEALDLETGAGEAAEVGSSDAESGLKSVVVPLLLVLLVSVLVLQLRGEKRAIHSEPVPEVETQKPEFAPFQDPNLVSGDYGGFKKLGKEPVTYVATRLVEDKTLAKLTKEPEVTHLCLNHSMIEGAGLRYLKDLPLLELTLESTGVEDEDLRPLLSIKSLEALSLRNTKVQGRNLHYFKHLTLLNVVDLDLDDSVVRDISMMQKLNWLKISAKSVSRRGALYIAENSRVQKLNLEGAGEISHTLSELAKMRSLRYLTLSERTVSKAEASRLPQLAINQLTLSDCRLDDHAAGALADCTRLKKLVLTDTTISDSRLRSLKGSLVDCRIIVADRSAKHQRYQRNMGEIIHQGITGFDDMIK